MPDILQNILISLCTSAVVGFFTFVIGTKSGKNQADRAKVQDLFIELLNEFESISKRLDTHPKVWGDFPHEGNHRRSISVTPLRKIKSNGDYVYIPEKQLKNLEELEKDALAYGWKVLELVEKIPTIMHDNPDWFESQGEYLPGDRYNKPSVYTMKSKGNQRSYRYANIYDFLDAQKLSRQLEEGIELVYNDERSPEHVSVTIIPELLKVTPAQFAHSVSNSLLSSEEGRSIVTEKTALASRLALQVQLLRKQARDPFPLWKTFGSAIKDMGRLK